MRRRNKDKQPVLNETGEDDDVLRLTLPDRIGVDQSEETNPWLPVAEDED